MLKFMVKDIPNVCLRFVEVSKRLDKYNFKFNNVRLSRATFMRLLIPDLLCAYEKVLYLDCDTVALRDVAEVYNVNIGKNMVGAVRDSYIIEIWKFRSHIKKYLLNDIQLSDPKDYFNCGVLLMNVEELKREYTSEKLLQVAMSRKWLWEDQDVLNYISRGRVFYLDAAWNVFWVKSPIVQQMMITNVDYARVLKAPKLIHYLSGSMPVNRPNERYSYYYWNCARKTPFYELLLIKTNKKFFQQPLVNGNASDSNTLTKEALIIRKIKGLFRNFMERGLLFTLKLITIHKNRYL
jgi:lipopolysaccharide biosynthesis glycosyltransferase